MIEVQTSLQNAALPYCHCFPYHRETPEVSVVFKAELSVLLFRARASQP
ncbi:hypothetical protein [Acidihalobacter yilgarnensis]|nr:hypothetical protein [Acidihalobacter yilgarnensis]